MTMLCIHHSVCIIIHVYIATRVMHFSAFIFTCIDVNTQYLAAAAAAEHVLSDSFSEQQTSPLEETIGTST